MSCYSCKELYTEMTGRNHRHYCMKYRIYLKERTIIGRDDDTDIIDTPEVCTQDKENKKIKRDEKIKAYKDIVSERDNLLKEYEEIKLKLDKARELIIDLNTFMVDLQLEPDEDSCMGMAFVNNRISEDWYYKLCNQISESGLLEKE